MTVAFTPLDTSSAPSSSKVQFTSLEDKQTLQSSDQSPSNQMSPIGQDIAAAASKIPGVQSLANTASGSGLENTALSLGSGIQQGMVDAASTATGNPNISKILGAPQITTEAQAMQPRTNLAGQIIGQVAPAVGLAASGAAALSPLMGSGLMTDMAANGIAGAALAGPKNRTSGGLIGAAVAPVANAVTSTAKFLTKATTIGTTVKKFVSDINAKIPGSAGNVAANSQANMWKASQSTETKLFDDFRATPGRVQGGDIWHAADKFLENNADELTPVQNKSIQNLMTNVSQSHNLADLHDARKIFSYDYGKFTEGRPLTGTASKEFRNLTTTISDSLQSNADRLGVGDKFKTANSFYQNTVMPLMNTGAKDTADALSQASKNPMDASKITDNLINKYVNPNRPTVAKTFLNSLDDTGRSAVETQVINNVFKSSTDSVGTLDFLKTKTSLQNLQKTLPGVFSPKTTQMINGLNKTIDEASHVLGMEVNTAKIGTTSKLYLGLGAASAIGGLGYAEGGKEGMGVGLLSVGIGLGLHKMALTPMGQSLLIRAGSPGGQEIGKRIVNGLMIQGALRANPVSTQNTGEQEDGGQNSNAPP